MPKFAPVLYAEQQAEQVGTSLNLDNPLFSKIINPSQASVLAGTTVEYIGNKTEKYYWKNYYKY